MIQILDNASKCQAFVTTCSSEAFTLELTGCTTSLEQIEKEASDLGWSSDDPIEHIILSTEDGAVADNSGVAAARHSWAAYKLDLHARPFRSSARNVAFSAAASAEASATRAAKAIKWLRFKAAAKESKKREAAALAALEGAVDGLEKERSKRRAKSNADGGEL